MLKAYVDGISSVIFFKNVPLELDTLDFVALLVRALHRNRMETGSIPTRAPTVAFLAAAPAWLGLK